MHSIKRGRKKRRETPDITDVRMELSANFERFFSTRDRCSRMGIREKLILLELCRYNTVWDNNRIIQDYFSWIRAWVDPLDKKDKSGVTNVIAIFGPISKALLEGFSKCAELGNTEKESPRDNAIVSNVIVAQEVVTKRLVNEDYWWTCSRLLITKVSFTFETQYKSTERECCVSSFYRNSYHFYYVIRENRLWAKSILLRKVVSFARNVAQVF